MAQSNSGLQLQRSAISFRRQGSSGVVWDDRFVSGEIARPKERSKPKFYSGDLSRPNKGQHDHKEQRQRSRAHDDLNVNINPAVNLRPIRTGRSNQPEIAEPPSPRLRGCGCCAGLGKSPRTNRTVRPIRSRDR